MLTQKELPFPLLFVDLCRLMIYIHLKLIIICVRGGNVGVAIYHSLAEI